VDYRTLEDVLSKIRKEVVRKEEVQKEGVLVEVEAFEKVVLKDKEELMVVGMVEV
jgi:hypothetical protein